MFLSLNDRVVCMYIGLMSELLLLNLGINKILDRGVRNCVILLRIVVTCIVCVINT